LRSIENARAFHKFDAAVDLIHVVGSAQRIKRELGCHREASDGRHGNGLMGRLDPLSERGLLAELRAWRTDRIVRLARAATRYRSRENTVLAGAGCAVEQVTTGREELFGRTDQERRHVVRLDAEIFAVRIERLYSVQDDADEIVGHGIQRYLCTRKHDRLAPLALPRSAVGTDGRAIISALTVFTGRAPLSKFRRPCPRPRQETRVLAIFHAICDRASGTKTNSGLETRAVGLLRCS